MDIKKMLDFMSLEAKTRLCVDGALWRNITSPCWS